MPSEVASIVNACANGPIMCAIGFVGVALLLVLFDTLSERW